jgi:hypothetical protein
MRTYVVQPGDTPAGIAARPDMAGCPKCSIDIIKSNPHKPTVVHPNGFVTFQDLREGEKLNLPDKWFDGSLDDRPRAYFAALPYHDGVTPSTLGDLASGVLGDYASLDAASAQIGALSAMGAQEFSDNVGATCDLLEASVREAYGNTSKPAAAGPAQDVHASTYWVRQRNQDLKAAIAAGDGSDYQVRQSILQVLSSGLGSARLALKEFYGSTPTPATGGAFPETVTTAAQAVASAIAADPNYCTSVAHPGSPVNSAVHVFKTAWNASESPKVPIGTSSYEQETAGALARVLGTAPSACAARVPTLPSSPPIGPSQPIIVPPEEKGLSFGTVLGLGLLGAGAVGGAIYLATKQEPIRARRVRRVRPVRRRRPDPTFYYNPDDGELP